MMVAYRFLLDFSRVLFSVVTYSLHEIGLYEFFVALYFTIYQI